MIFREDNRVLNLAVTAAILLASASAFAEDVIPFFRPDPKPVYGPVLPDPVATECGVDDQRCIDEHDALARDMAIAASNRDGCASSTHPLECEAVYDMVAGDVDVKRDPVLDDPCAWVVLVDRGVAVVTSRKLGVTKRLANRGWAARTFVGHCDVAGYVAAYGSGDGPKIPMPRWEAPKASPVAQVRR